MLTAIYVFMAFSIVLCLIGFWSQTYDGQRTKDKPKKEVPKYTTNQPNIYKNEGSNPEGIIDLDNLSDK